MKSRFCIALFLMAIHACAPEPEITPERTSVNQVSTIVKQGTSSPEPQKTPIPAPTATVIKVKAQVKEEGRQFTDLCLKNSVLPEPIHFPTDLTVSKDGQTLYMLASYCSQLPDKPNLDSNYDICIDKPEELVPHGEKFVYQLKEDNNFKPTPIFVDEEPILGCQVKEIETTNDGQTLFLNDVINHRIHKYDGELSTFVEAYGLSPYTYVELYAPGRDNRVFWDVPQYLKVNQNALLYRKIANAGMLTYYETREVELSSGQDTEKYCTFGSDANGFTSAQLSGFYKDQAYFFDVTYGETQRSLIHLSTNEASPENCLTKDVNLTYFIEPPSDISGYFLKGMVIDSKGFIFVSDAINDKIYKINLPADLNDEYGASLEEYAGNASGHKDGNLSEAQFNTPTTLVIDAQDNIYVADTGNHAIRKITPEGVVSTLFKQEIP